MTSKLNDLFGKLIGREPKPEAQNGSRAEASGDLRTGRITAAASIAVIMAALSGAANAGCGSKFLSGQGSGGMGGGSALDAGHDAQNDSGTSGAAGADGTGGNAGAGGAGGGVHCDESLLLVADDGSIHDQDAKHGQADLNVGCFSVDNQSCKKTHGFQFLDLTDNNGVSVAFSPVDLIGPGSKVVAQSFIPDPSGKYLLGNLGIILGPQERERFCISVSATNISKPGEVHQLAIAKSGAVGSDVVVNGAFPVEFGKITVQ